MNEIIALRCFQPVYILLDSMFLLLLAGLLIWKKKYMTFLVGVLFGFVYLAVDYGCFHLLHHSRHITEGYSLFWVLVWMSMSYGFTNFTWIWLALSKDKHLKEWTLLILLWWFVCPMLAASLGHAEVPITISRTTTEYHSGMAVFLFISYLAVIIWNMMQPKEEWKFSIKRLLFIGIGVQLAWETALLLGGIRSAVFSDWGQKMRILITNSLLETNLGLPACMVLYLWYAAAFNEQLKKREKRWAFKETLAKYNQGEDLSL